jgi:prepilin-type processing-associated H-X9-DG protein
MKRGCIVFGVILGGLIGGWFVWAVGQGQEAARRAQCISNLKWLGLAFLNYYRQHGSLPPGTIPNPNLPPEHRLSWVVEVWDAQSSGLILNVDRSKGWNEPPNTSPKMLPLKGVTLGGDPESTGDWVACPDDPAYHSQKKPSWLTYVGVAGVGADAPRLPPKHPRAGVFGFDRVTRFEDITDGLPQTMMVIETTRNHGSWTAGGLMSVRGVDPVTQPYIGQNRPFGGYHPGGANVLMADGSVRFLRETIDPRVFEAMATIAGGEMVPADLIR